MFTKPRRRRGAVIVASIALALLIASPLALSRPEASSESLSTVTPSPAAVEALSARYTDVNLWSGYDLALERYEQQKIEYIQAVIAEQERQRAAAAAAEAERQRQAAAAKAAAAEKAQQEAAKPAPAPKSAPAAPTAAPSSYSGNCGGWESLVAAYFPGEVAKACSVMMCESRGNPQAKNPGSSASGLWQFLDGTWKSTTGTPAPARQYSAETQTAAAAKLRNSLGWSQWECS